MTRGKFTIFAALLSVAMLFLVSCGEHSFWDDLAGWLEVSSSSDGLSGEASSSSYGSNGGTPSSSGRASSDILGTVGPLLQTEWGQGSPYSSMLPETGDGICYAIAFAQIMKYYNKPARGNGQIGPWTYTPTGQSYRSYEMPAVNFEIDYDWDNMLNSYRYGSNATEQQKNAVATLIYHIVAASGGGTSTIFGYGENIIILIREHYDDATFEAIIRQQLNAGIPINATTKVGTVGPHAVIIDGYDSTGRKFHFNCGWGGSGDGWYSLNDYICTESLRFIDINFRPNDDGYAGYEVRAMNFITAGKTSVSQNELFPVSMPLANMRGKFVGQYGTALVDNNGNIVKVIGSVNITLTGGSSLATMETRNFVPETVEPGQYSLMSVVRPEGGEWELVEQSIAEGVIPKAIEITVTAGEANGGGYGLVLSKFTPSKTSVAQDEVFTVDYRIGTIGSNNFPGGEVGAALVDNNGNIVEVVGTARVNTLNPPSVGNGSRKEGTLSCKVPAAVPPGQYRLRIIVKQTGEEKWRIATLSYANVPNADISLHVPTSIDFSVTAGEANGGGYGLALTSFTSSRTTISQNELFTVSSALKNIAQDTFPGGQIGTALADNNGNIKAIIGSRNRSAINPGSTSSAGDAYSYVPSTITPGQYKLRIAVKPTDSEEWRIAMSMPDIPNAIPITVTAGLANGGGYGIVLEEFSSDKNSVPKNEAFNVTVKSRNRGLDAFPGGNLGVALVDNNGNIVEVIKTVNYSSLSIGSSRTSTISNCAVPNSVASGRYKLRIVAKPAGEEWRIATLALPDVASSIDFEVR
jgi:hypothetical protein